MTVTVAGEKHVLRIERDFRAPIEKVFEAFTNPEHFSQWWGPEGTKAADIVMDVSEGGRWHTAMVNKEGEKHIVEGVYKVIAPFGRLVFTWQWVKGGAGGEETTVELAFTAVEGGTRLRLKHGIFDSEEGPPAHNMGWTSALNSLETFLSA